ncbi:MAG: HAMP domain-containing sensor histidine kinase [Pseudoruegeria sp.]
MNSIRQRMVVWLALTVFCVTATFCGATYFFMRNALQEDFKRSAVEQLQSVANAVKVWTDGDIYVELNSTVLTGFAVGGDHAFVVRDVKERTLIAQSNSLNAANRTLEGLANASIYAPIFGVGSAPTGSSALLVTQIMPAQWGWDLTDTSVEIAPGVRETVVEITLAVDFAPLHSRLSNLGWLTFLIAVASAIAAALAAFFTTRSVLRPLRDLTHRAEQIREPSYSRPFPTDGPSELRPIAERLNALLVRLADASIVERRFTADAAHELRTPIAELRTLTDVALRFPTAPEQLDNVVRSCNDISIRLTSLIDALLGIARKDAMAASLQMTSVNPPEMLREIISENAVQIAKHDLTVDLQAPQDHKIMSDETLLRSILNNLVGNAICHAPHGSAITLEYTATQGSLHFLVSNPAPGLEVSDVSRLFEPFWRKEGQRPNQDHAGLGLALSLGFADILGFDLNARLTEQKIIEIILMTRETAT